MSLIKLREYSIKEIETEIKDLVLSNITSNPSSAKLYADIDGEDVRVLNDKYKVFFTNGYKCAFCGIEAQKFVLEKYTEHPSWAHLNLYTVDKNGKDVLMSIEKIDRENAKEFRHERFVTICEKCRRKLQSDRDLKKLKG